MAVSKDEILEAISNMSIMQVVELISDMEKKFGVTAAAPVAVAAVAAGGAAAAAAVGFAVFGVAAGGIYPAGFAWLVEGCPPSRYGYASGLFTRAYGLGSLFGPLCFGIAIEGAGEKGFFALALALGLMGIAWSIRSSKVAGAP